MSKKTAREEAEAIVEKFIGWDLNIVSGKSLRRLIAKEIRIRDKRIKALRKGIEFALDRGAKAATAEYLLNVLAEDDKAAGK